MKLTCVMIVAVLFLTACQLTTAEISSRGKQKYRVLRSADENPKWTRECTRPGGACYYDSHCCRHVCHEVFNTCM
nr:conotoxin precursor O1 [Conus ebraeus]UMA82844.1 conotoxin precursor O1 [Conus ebraeus]UMA83143.1 conotoxin precursor O1 [Conus judaeus]